LVKLNRADGVLVTLVDTCAVAELYDPGACCLVRTTCVQHSIDDLQQKPASRISFSSVSKRFNGLKLIVSKLPAIASLA
jgi:hypothetical protein